MSILSTDNETLLKHTSDANDFEEKTGACQQGIESKKYGRVCYVDPNELFPQATYYLHPNLKRPDYHKNSKKSGKNTKVLPKDSESNVLLKLDIEENNNEESEEREKIVPVDVLVSSDREKTQDSKKTKQSKKSKGNISHELFEAEDSTDENDLENEEPNDIIFTDDNISGALFLKKKIVCACIQSGCINDHSLFRSNVKKKKMQKQNIEIKTKKFGTWDGVFMSCVLNIFSVLMFIRLGFVVGQAGLLNSFLIILLSTVVTTLTTLSMAAIATNGEQRAGGAYYMISRTLGPAIGSAVGILYCFGMSVAISMHIIGIVETMVDTFGLTTDSLQNGTLSFQLNIAMFSKTEK
ncbi:sodium-potassium-chloride cotransporter [Reticulomyxa filosa]|uniref:Sodium-potassium-chloride cotransporter n=1 Tax=Reticulomyxa filosa TaxID=46433 RepID=X6NKK7_RETFI|nr:sodium-potassium-chloride cotransporter [Reticulomyxa filosa]|eukprot:ETO26433.1 sodium-potassium-chloride cotransporter [Reticulomyxa filosa]